MKICQKTKLGFISGYPGSKRLASVNVHMPSDTVTMNVGNHSHRWRQEGFWPSYYSQLMLPGLGHPELRNSEQHSPEKRKRERMEGGNQQI